MECFITTKKSYTSKKIDIFDGLKRGLKYIITNRLYPIIIVSAFLNFFFTGLVIVGFPYIYKEILHLNKQLFGIAQSIYLIGAIIGSIIISFMPDVKDHKHHLTKFIFYQIICLLSIAVLLIPSSLNTTFKIIMLFSIIMILGMVNIITGIPLKVLLQKIIPDKLRGRIFSIIAMISGILSPVSIAITGILIDLIDIHIIFLINSFSLLIILYYTVRLKIFNHLDNFNANT